MLLKTTGIAKNNISCYKNNKLAINFSKKLKERNHFSAKVSFGIWEISGWETVNICRKIRLKDQVFTYFGVLLTT
jgi:hypothetical protein